MATNRRAEPTRIKATIHATKSDNLGEWTITLKIPKSDGVKAAALALYTETVFDVEFYVDTNSAGAQRTM